MKNYVEYNDSEDKRLSYQLLVVWAT